MKIWVLSYPRTGSTNFALHLSKTLNKKFRNEPFYKRDYNTIKFIEKNNILIKNQISHMPKTMWDELYKNEIFVEKFNIESEEWYSLGVSEFIKFHKLVKQSGWKMIYLARKNKLSTTMSYTTARKNNKWLNFYDRYEEYNHKDYKLVQHWYDLQHIYAEKNDERVFYYEDIFSDDIDIRTNTINSMKLNLSEEQVNELANNLSPKQKYYQPKVKII